MSEKQKFKWHSWATPWILLFPTLVGLFVFRLIPIVSSFVLSFSNWNLVRDPVFNGLENYKELFSDPDFWKIFGNTLKITVGYVAGSMVFGLLLALLVNNKIKGMNFFRAAIYLPVITSSVAVGIVWMRILGPKYGIIDAILDGSINKAPTKTIPYFNFEVPTALPGVDPKILDPRDTYADASQWEEKAKDLAGRFVKNFAKYTTNEAGKALVEAGPKA